MHKLFRLTPKLPVQAYDTYALIRPVTSHTRRATCQEVNCGAHLRGWRTQVDLTTELGRRQANYIRLIAGRHYVTEENGDSVTFRFPAGQRCFTEHRMPLDRDPLFIKRGGDWRAYTSQAQPMRAADWIDDLHTNTDTLAEHKNRG